MVPIHQFTRIGDYAIVGAVSRAFMDVVPYALCGGETDTYIVGINKVGLERQGFSSERRTNIRRAYKILFREGLSWTDAVIRLKESFPGDKDIEILINFVAATSKRGIMRMKMNAEI
jgi:UDP-N-acetylglucosamine acyltransferase